MTGRDRAGAAVVWVALLVASHATLPGCGQTTSSEAEAAPEGAPPLPSGPQTVVKVYDGDTLTLATGDRVRLRWANTPELKPEEPFAREARELAATFALDQRVELDASEAVPRDSYGRIIASVRRDGRDLATELVEAGLAHLFLIPPVGGDVSALVKAQLRARRAGLGIWSTDRYQGAVHITSFHANARGDDRDNVNGEYLRLCNVSGAPLDLGGWTLTDRNGQVFTVPAVVVPPGHTVTTHSGTGANQLDPSAPLKVHLGSPRPIWRNKGDTATLRDPRGAVVDRVRHDGR